MAEDRDIMGGECQVEVGPQLQEINGDGLLCSPQSKGIAEVNHQVA